MTKPNANEKDHAKKAVALLKRAANEADELNLYMLCNERDAAYLANGKIARAAIAKAIGELSALLGLPTEVPADVAATEG